MGNQNNKEIKLNEEKSQCISFYVGEMNLKIKRKYIKMFEEYFNINFKIKKIIFTPYILEACYFSKEDSDRLWMIKINKNEIRIGIMGAYANKEIKDILMKVMDIIKELTNEKHLKIEGIKDLYIPEIENNDFKITKV